MTNRLNIQKAAVIASGAALLLAVLVTPHIVKAYVVPAGITAVYIQAWGAGGILYGQTGQGNCTGQNIWFTGNNAAGVGGYTAGWAPVTPNQTLTVVTGAAGGGGSSGFGSGGGYSGVFTGSPSQATALVIAGGGGGSGAYVLQAGTKCYSNIVGPSGAPGGGSTGGSSGGTTGGSQSAAGSGGSAGGPLTGGVGTAQLNGGGGSGYWGGGGGYNSSPGTGTGGGGGSGYCAPSVTSCTNTSGGGNGGAGSVTITAGYPTLTLTANPVTVEQNTPAVLTYSATGGSGFSSCYILGGRFGTVPNGSNLNGQFYNAVGTSGTLNTGALTGGGSNFTDSSSYAHAITPVSNASISGAAYKFGAASGAFDGASYISSTDNAQYRLTGDYTIDLWVRPSTVSSVNGGIVSKANSSGVSPFLIYQSNATYVFYSSSNGTSWDIASAKSLGTAVVNSWTHLTVVRSGNTYYAFNNGVQTATWSSASVPMQTADPLLVGKQYTGGAFFNGYVDELRISNSARWTSAFTPPASAYASDANTMFLMHGDTGGTAGFFQYECFSTLNQTWYVTNLAIPYTAAALTFTPSTYTPAISDTVTFSSTAHGVQNNGSTGTTLPNMCTITRTGP